MDSGMDLLWTMTTLPARALAAAPPEAAWRRGFESGSCEPRAAGHHIAVAVAESPEILFRAL